MSVFWLEPAAWWGLAALAVPIMIHLLASHRSRRLLFPSLRFLKSTRLAALKQRRIADWPLLAIRVCVIAAAVSALASPVVVSEARWQSWGTRVARAVVVARPRGAASDAANEIAALSRDAQTGAFVSAVFADRPSVADGLRDAARWLERQPPSAYEAVVVGDLRVGDLNARDFDLLSAATGVRLLPITAPGPVREAELSAIADVNGTIALQDILLTLGDQSTAIERRATGAAPQIVSVIAAPRDQARAEAALRAVIGEGILLPRDSRRLIIEFVGAPSTPIQQPASEAWMRRALERLTGLSGGSRDSQLIVRTGTAAADVNVLEQLLRIVNTALMDDLGDLEPARIPAALLAQWSRPSGELPRDALPVDEGDRRYFWAAALGLLLVEQWLRRRPQQRMSVASSTTVDREARVA